MGASFVNAWVTGLQAHSGSTLFYSCSCSWNLVQSSLRSHLHSRAVLVAYASNTGVSRLARDPLDCVFFPLT